MKGENNLNQVNNLNDQRKHIKIVLCRSWLYKSIIIIISLIFILRDNVNSKIVDLKNKDNNNNRDNDTNREHNFLAYTQNFKDKENNKNDNGNDNNISHEMIYNDLSIFYNSNERDLAVSSVTTQKTYSNTNQFLTTFKSQPLTTKGYQMINGVSVLLDEKILITSYIKDDYLVLEAFDVENNFSSLASYSHTKVSFKSSILNNKVYIASSSIAYIDNNEFMMYYTKEYEPNIYGLYSHFIKFNTVSKLFETSSHSSYNDALISPINRNGVALSDISFLYTTVINFTYNCSPGNEAISVLTATHYK